MISRRSGRLRSRMGVVALILIVALNAISLLPTASSAQSATPLATTDPVIMAVGDIACGHATPAGGPCQERQTSDLVLQAQPDAALILGDNQYECGQLADFEQYFDPTWGRFKSLIRPAVGNHEYQTTNTDGGRCNDAQRGAVGYWTYFGDAATPRQPGCRSYCDGYYSYDLGQWHLIVLNTNCSPVGGCDRASKQGQWLAADLAAHPAACTLVYMHHPRFSSGHHGNQDQSADFWQMMYQAGVDVVLAGHDHDYERFTPQTPQGAPDTTYGIREFVVGTGGKNLTKPNSSTGNLPTSEVYQDSTFGVLRLTLHPDSYDWNFVAVPGDPPFSDNGTGRCHAAPPAPAVATPVASPAASPVALAQPGGTVLFNDDFESGTLSKWTSINGLAISPSDGDGQFAAHATASGNGSYATANLAAPATDLTVSLRFNLLAKDNESVNLLKLRTAGNDSVLGVYLSNTGKLAYRSDVSRETVVSQFDIAPKQWHTLTLTVHVAGAESLVSITIDGALVAGLNGPAALGQTPIGRVQLGENVTGQTFDLLFDDLLVTGHALPVPAATPAATPIATPVASPRP